MLLRDDNDNLLAKTYESNPNIMVVKNVEYWQKVEIINSKKLYWIGPCTQNNFIQAIESHALILGYKALN